MSQPIAPGPQQNPATWDAVAPSYAQFMAQWTDYAEAAVHALPLSSSDRVLDIAAGPGTLSFVAAAQAARVDAVDFSPTMIEELSARARREGVDNITSAVMDAQALGFPDATFDAAFCIFGFFFFPDRARAFREMHRVLRPGGRALIATWSPIDRRPAMKVLFDAFAEALPEMPRPAKGDLQDPEECVREMSEAGFVAVEAQRFTASAHFDSAEQYLDMSVRSAAPLVALRKKLGEEAWSSAMAKVLAVLRRSVPEAGFDLSAEAILTRGTR